MIAVTNRYLCERDFLEQIEGIASSSMFQAVILREKDLSAEEYESLAQEVLSVCRKYKKECILHSFYDVAERLGCTSLHLPLSLFLGDSVDLNRFQKIGTSVHSVAEARQAEAAGADYLMAGHIYETDCKKGLPGRGLPFLREVCRSVSIPVYAVGGITPENLPQVLSAGAKDGCVMSFAMEMAF